MAYVNAERLVRDWLAARSELSSYTIAFSVPETRPVRFITVERVGGSSSLFLDDATIAVQVWETSRWNASNAAISLVRPALMAMSAHANVGDVDIVSVIDDPEPGAPYQARYQITVRLTTAVSE